MKTGTGSNGYKTDKERIAVQTLDLFTKIFCIKDNKEELEFECENCEFNQLGNTCLVKVFARKRVPDYKEFGSMGDL